MLHKLRARLTYANVMSTIAVFGVLAGGTAYAANTVFSTDIVDGEVKSVDIGNNEIGSADVKDNTINTFDVHSFLGVDVVDETLTGADIDNGSLTADDIAVNKFGTTINIGSVPAHSCIYSTFIASFAAGADLVITPQYETTNSFLSYTVEYRATPDVSIKVCNPTASAIDDGTTHFNGLVIQHFGP
jgi:hypothetical protein